MSEMNHIHNSYESLSLVPTLHSFVLHLLPMLASVE